MEAHNQILTSETIQFQVQAHSFYIIQMGVSLWNKFLVNTFGSHMRQSSTHITRPRLEDRKIDSYFFFPLKFINFRKKVRFNETPEYNKNFINEQ